MSNHFTISRTYIFTKLFQCVETAPALRHNSEMYWLKFSLLVIANPKRFTLLVDFISLLLIKKGVPEVSVPSFLIRMALNFSALAIMWFSVNQLVAFCESSSKHLTTILDVLACAYSVLSSAKLYISVFLKMSTKSFMNILNNIGPRIDPCGTPAKYPRTCSNVLWWIRFASYFLDTSK